MELFPGLEPSADPLATPFGFRTAASSRTFGTGTASARGLAALGDGVRSALTEAVVQVGTGGWCQVGDYHVRINPQRWMRLRLRL